MASASEDAESIALPAGAIQAASLLCGLAPDPAVLIGARVLQGAGATLMFPQTLTGIQLNFAEEARKRAIGMYAIALSAGAVSGQILGGALIYANLAGTHWRAIFLINVPVGIAGLVAAAHYLPADSARVSRRVDFPGVAVLSVSVLLVVLPLCLGRSQGWPTWTWICLAASLPVIAVFISAQRRLAERGGAPVVNVRMLGNRPIACALATALVATGTYYALLFTLAQYLQGALGHSPVVSGFTLVPWVAAFGIAGQIVRRLPGQLMHQAPLAGCLLLAGAYAAFSAALFAGHHDELLLIVLLGTGGLGLGVQFSALIAHLTSAVHTDYAADLSGVSTTTMQIGAALGVAALGTLYLAQNPTSAGRHFAAAVAGQHDVVREQRFESAQVAALGACEEPAGELVPLLAGGLEPRPSLFDVAPRPGSQLADVVLGLPHDPGDLVVAVVEHVAQQQHGTLLRRQALEQDQQRHRKRVGHLRLSGWIVVLAGEDRFREPLADVALPARSRRAQLVDGQPRGHGRDERTR